MPRRQGTAGQLLVNEILPEDLRDYQRVLNKKQLGQLLQQLAEKHPEKYRDVSFQLGQLGARNAYYSGGYSFGLAHLRQARSAQQRRQQLQQQLGAILDNDQLSDQERDQQVLKLVGDLMKSQQDEILQESIAEKNPLAAQLQGAGRGNPMNLASLRGSDGLYQDHRGQVIPVPVLRSYSQGLSPAEYWAGTYGARTGVIATKFAVADAGFMSKQLFQAAHRNVVTDLDRDGEPETLLGLPVDIDDDDNEGALLARATGDYPRNTVLTPKILAQLRSQGIRRLLVRSPAVSGSPEGGVYARDVGMREFNRLPYRGENVGAAAAQSVGEKLSQSQLSAKHAGGVAGETKSLTGFAAINAQVQVPKTFKGGAAHAELDGTVSHIEPAPAGGQYVLIDGQKHYVAKGFEIRVKPGQEVEAGDVLSEGLPNPAKIVQHKGVGEGRRYFIQSFLQTLRDSGISTSRRNVELLARGLINHVRLNDELGDYAPDDVVPYSVLEHSYRPREGFQTLAPARAVGRYLERPYLHYSIGTRIRPSMLRDFEEFGVEQLDTHEDPPPFQAEMIRGMSNLQHDPDWMTRLLASGQKKSLLPAVQRGGSSDEAGTSFVPGLARAVDFGRSGILRSPSP